MKKGPLNKDFIPRPGQEDLIYYPFAGERQFQNFAYRQYAGGKKEKKLLAKYYTITGNEYIINRLITRLENESFPGFSRISSFIQQFQKVLHTGIRDEPYTSGYFNSLLTVLNPFQELVTIFREKVQTTLSDWLNSRGINKLNTNGSADIESKDVDAIITMMEQFTEELLPYYDKLNAFLDRESRGNAATAVSTLIEQFLVHLITMLEKAFMNAEIIRGWLESWKNRLMLCEMQEMYN